jgi:hypothetical protein
VIATLENNNSLYVYPKAFYLYFIPERIKSFVVGPAINMSDLGSARCAGHRLKLHLFICRSNNRRVPRPAGS